MPRMSDLLRPTVYRVIQEYAQIAGIPKPQIYVSDGSKNGDSYSGEVYRVQVRPEGWTEQEVAETAEPDALLRDPHFNQLTLR